MAAERMSAKNLGEFMAAYYTRDDFYLWDVKQLLLLPWAWSFEGKRASVASDRGYVYIGRTASKQVYETMQLVRRGNRLRVYGAKGSGKTIAVATVCSHLHQSGMKRIIYLEAGKFIKDPRQTLLDALMISFSRDKQVLDAVVGQSAEDLRTWCHVRSAVTELLVFVVDDVDAFDAKEEDSQEVRSVKADAERYLDRISATAARVEVASASARARAIWESSDKAYEKATTIWFDGPFDEEELLTWRGWSKLPHEVQKDVDYYTGGMPGLLQLYEEAHGSSSAFCEVVDSVYVSKLCLFIWNLAPAELLAAVDFILRGSLSGMLKGKVDFTCFYKKEGRYHFLCPYLARKGKELLINKLHQAEVVQEQREIISKWVAVIRVDLKGQKVPKRTPRIGWDVEGCIIDMMRFQKSLFAGDDATTFSRCYEYPRGGAYAACKALTDLELKGGVLLVPRAFNERAVDVVFFKKEGSVLKLVAVQITVSSWKVKSRKQSHLVWKQAVAPAFKAGLAGQTLGITQVLDEYWCAMPEKIVADKSQEEPKFQEVAEGDEDETVKPEDVPEEVIRSSIDRYKCGWKVLAAVHPSLREFDNALDLEEPAKLTLPKLVHCSGNTKDEDGIPCGRRARVAAPYYCTKCQMLDDKFPAQSQAAVDGGKVPKKQRFS